MKHITNTMKTFISLALCSSMLTLAISCKEMKEDIKTNSKEFYEGGIHFTITHGCPLVTKTSIGETESLTITGNLEDKTATMYVVEKRDDSGLTFLNHIFKMEQKFPHRLSTTTESFVMKFLQN